MVKFNRSSRRILQKGVAMSDNKHTGQTKFTAWVDIVQLQKLDDKIKELGYTSRTEWFREKMRETINDKPPQK